MSQYENAFSFQRHPGIPCPLHGILLLRDRFDGDAGNDPALNQAEQFVDACLAAFSVAEDLFPNPGIQTGEKIDGQLTGLNQPVNRLFPLGA